MRDNICTSARKVRFSSRATAEKTRQRFSTLSGFKLFIYHCPSCGSYHLTKRLQWETVSTLKEKA